MIKYKNINFKFKSYKFFISKNNKILKFNRHISNVLDEKDMVNLFLGFVRLIRKSIKFELENEYKQKLSFYQNKIQNLLSKIK